MFKRNKRAGKFQDPLLDALEAKRRKRAGKPPTHTGAIWSGSGSIDDPAFSASRPYAVRPEPSGILEGGASRKPRSTEMFAMRRDGRIDHFYPAVVAVRMCGSGRVVAVRVTEDATGAYWAWWSAEHGKHMLVYDHRMLVDMCFPYGPKAEEERGRGEVVQVRVEVLQEVPQDVTEGES